MAIIERTKINGGHRRIGEHSSETVKSITTHFQQTPARIIEPAVGASTWASGNRHDRPHGILTANEAKKKEC